MRMKLKQWGCYAVIIILLPYIVTVFLNGSSIATSTNVDHIYIKVKAFCKNNKILCDYTRFLFRLTLVQCSF